MNSVTPQLFDELAALLRRTIAEARKLLHTHLKIAPRTKRHKIFILLVLNDLLRKCESVAAMVEAEAHAGVNVVARSAFESYADLLNLFAHGDSYVEYMMWLSHGQQKTLFQSFVDHASPFAEDFARNTVATLRKSPAEILAETAKEQDDIAALLPAKYKDSSGAVRGRDIFRFELAGKLHQYNALYRHLSGVAHGRVSALGEGVFASLDAPLTWPPSDELIARPRIALDSLCVMLRECGVLAARKFEKPTAVFDRLSRELQDIRGDSSVIL